MTAAPRSRVLRGGATTYLNAKPTTTPLTLRATSESLSLGADWSDARHACRRTCSGRERYVLSSSCGDADSGQSSVSGERSCSALAANGCEMRVRGSTRERVEGIFLISMVERECNESGRVPGMDAVEGMLTLGDFWLKAAWGAGYMSRTRDGRRKGTHLAR